MAKMKCSMTKEQMVQRGKVINDRIVAKGRELNSKKSGQTKPKKKTYV